jgi:hypothetical protein
MTRTASRVMTAGLAAALSVSAAGVARASNIYFEAESVRDRDKGSITSPLLIKDDAAASGGSYVAVAAGTNSGSYAPDSTTDGIAKYRFIAPETGTYRVWARVSAANNGDDSFWVRMGDSGAWIRFNGWTLGTAYHWVLVGNDPPAGPSTFGLVADATYELNFAYREDGTRLDAVYITNDGSFNPNTAPAGPPAPPVAQPSVNGGGSAKISWSAVPGASYYVLERRSGSCTYNPETQCCEPDDPYVVVASTTQHKFTTTSGGEWQITAVNASGSSPHPIPQGPYGCYPEDPSHTYVYPGTFHWRTQLPSLAVTPPMAFSPGGYVRAPAGTDSKTAPPAHGRASLDFELAAPAILRVWAEVDAPNTSQDSFWVQFNDAPWITWNNLNDYCETLYDSSKSGSPIVRMSLGAGSHRLEFAYREGGAALADNIIILEDYPNQGEQCSD